MKQTTTDRGRHGESIALAFLEARGLALLARNYRCRGGEIDLVMLDHGTLAIVEVRLRGRTDFGGAASTVNSRKQWRVTLAARHLLATRAELRRLPARFDVVAIDASNGDDECRVEWIRDAFRSA